MTTLTRRKRLLFAAFTFFVIAFVMTGCVTAADVYAHWRTQDDASVNVWGYRGNTQSRKPANSLRVVILGGSTVFGWGLPAHESIAAFLQQRLDATGAKTSVINLGAPNQGAYSFLPDLQDYEYLDYDIAVLYEGYNDLGTTVPNMRDVFTLTSDNRFLWRRSSPVFRMFGYYPILPVVLTEKADMIMAPAGGAAAAAAKPGLLRRAAASALQTAAETTGKIVRIGGIQDAAPRVVAGDDCSATWKFYCGSVRAAIDWATAHHKRVLVVGQPYIAESHIDQQAQLAAMLERRYGRDGSVRYLDLGRVFELSDLKMSYDGRHLTAAGNDKVAAQLVEPIRAMAGAQ